MAVYRNVQISFWTDSKITDDFTPEDKYFYLYLITNPHTKISGCYELSIKQMSIDTGYSKDSIEKLLDRMQNLHKVIRYSKENKEVLLINWPKYNWTISPKVKKAIADSIGKIKTEEFRDFITNLYNHIDRVSIGYPYPINTTFSLVSDSLVSDSLYVDSKVENQHDEKEKKRQHILEVEEFFESVWKLYIRKEGKNAVTKEAKEEIFKVGYDRIKKSIERYANKTRGCEKKYILMGSTFFNGRYRDYLDEEPVEKPTKEPEPEEEELTDEEWVELVKEHGVV
jgi:hypothetical protein